MKSNITLKELNAAAAPVFTEILGGIFEHSPYIAERAAEKRPFASGAALHAAMVAEIEAAGVDAQLQLILSHPELAGKAAIRGELTEESSREQSGVGLDRCSPEEFVRLQNLNTRYKKQFGFPFIVAVRGHTRQSIIALFQQRLENDRETELRECLRQVYRIGQLRLEELLAS